MNLTQMEYEIRYACEHYEHRAPTVDRYLSDLYDRLFNGKGKNVTVYELTRAETLWFKEFGEYLSANYAANYCYKLEHELGRDITGHAGF